MSLIKKLILIALRLTLALFCAAVVLFSSVYLYLSPGLPDVDTLKDVQLQIPLRVFSSDGKMIGEFGEKRREPMTIDEAPQNMINAILAAEDDRFYQHRGVSIRSLIRAASELLASGQIQSGGSTITMQVARNFFLSQTKTFSRKFNEILLALKIEQALTKEEVLELYLNKIYLGNRAYGFKVAAQVYYGKPLEELTLAQTAMIAGLPKAPSTFNPIVNPSRALVRRDWILGRMLSLQFISQTDYNTAIKEPVSARYHGQRLDLYAPYVAEMAREKAVDLFGEDAYTAGYQIVTTIDSRLQAKAQQAVVNGLLAYTDRHGYRGPEMTFDADVLPSSTAHEADFTDLLDKLKEIPVYGGLMPAAVINVADKQITAMLSSGETITVPWANGLQDARPYINENAQGSKPRKVADILSVGDIIRLWQDDSAGWHLKQVPAAQAALIALNPKNGAIQSLVGGFDFNQSKFNRVTQAERQPGSNFKPFIYTAGLESGLTPASLFNDAPVVIEDVSLEGAWRPQNASGKFYGPTPLRKAFYLSRNLVSIRLLKQVGISNTIDGMERFGIDPSALSQNLSMALGSHVMTPIDIVTAYSVFANGGYKINPFLVDTIKSHSGDIVYQHEPAVTPSYVEGIDEETEEQIHSLSQIDDETTINDDAKSTGNQSFSLAPRVIDERTAYIMDSMLRDVVAKGTGRRALALNRSDLAGKTGTTNGPTDAWFSGYNHAVVATAWIGFDDNKNLGRREYGGSAALPIWIEYMQSALEGVPEYVQLPPNGIVTVRIDPETGKRAFPDNQDGIFEIFRKENAPTDFGGRSVNNEQEQLPFEGIWTN